MTIPTPGAQATVPGDPFFFYSNNPEPVTMAALADSNKFLMKATMVSGTGQVYCWHQNMTGQQINSTLRIRNPPTNTDTVKVTVTNYGLVGTTSNTRSSGVDAWFDFFQRVSRIAPVNLKPGQTTDLFKQAVAPLGIWGIVARLQITGSTQPVEMYDIAYRTASPSAATAFAPIDSSLPPAQRRRGIGTGYRIFVNFTQPTSANAALLMAQGITVAGQNDSFSGADLPTITDPSGMVSGPLDGNYGTQMCVTWPVQNDVGQPVTLNFYAGNHNTGDVGTTFVIKYLTLGGCRAHLVLPPQDQYRLAVTATLPANTSRTYQFQIMTVGGYSYPLTLCVRASLL